MYLLKETYAQRHYGKPWDELTEEEKEVLYTYMDEDN